MLDLILIRHGETDFNRLWRFQGHTDTGLNRLGLAQAQRVGDRLARERIAAIVSSDLQRARATAEPTAQRHGLAIKTDPVWREQAFGAIEGLTAAEIAITHPELWALHQRQRADEAPPGGETRQAFADRIASALAALVSAQPDGAPVVVFTHGGVLDMLWRRVTGQSLDTGRSCAIPNAGINRLHWDGSQLSIVAWADDAHLADLT
jgi:probable phosphoglycerate mutase